MITSIRDPSAKCGSILVRFKPGRVLGRGVFNEEAGTQVIGLVVIRTVTNKSV